VALQFFDSDTIILETYYYYYIILLLICRNSGYDVFNSVIKWHPASIGYPACIRDPASTRTSSLVPRLVLDTQLLCIRRFYGIQYKSHNH